MDTLLFSPIFSYIFDDTSSDDDDDNDTSEVQIKEEVFKSRIDNLNLWNEKEFIARFRVSKEVALLIASQIEEEFLFSTEKNFAVRPIDQVLVTLQYYGSGSLLRCVNDISGLDKSTICRIIHRVTQTIAKLRPQYINMPGNEEERLAVATDFHKIARFPKVLGVIDCTHIEILTPGGEYAEDFRNKKGTFSLKVQVVGDANLNIRNIVARWPGSVHGSHMFNRSILKSRFESGEFGDHFLLGDSEYALNSYMLTPLNNPQTQAEKYYNKSQIHTKNTTKRLFGLWKQRFPIIGRKLGCNIDHLQCIIVATAVLHNICLKLNVAQPPHNAQIYGEFEENNNITNHVNADPTTRNDLINNYFSRYYYDY